MTDKNKDAFLALVRAGLWEQEAQLSQYGSIDFNEIRQLAAEQSVIGLVAAGIEHVVDIKVPQEVALTFVGMALQLEQQNMAMNDIIGILVDKMRSADIYTLLVKGQGIAQCYERPLWRSCGDVDFLLSEENYSKAKSLLIPFASAVETESKYSKHIGLTIDSWIVELHGSMRCGLTRRIDKGIDDALNDVFYGGMVRSWMDGSTQVLLPAPDNDVIFVFTHFLKHFYKEGLGLRQICDWVRLLWSHKNTLNIPLLEKRLCEMNLMSEWRTFATFGVELLGMPSDVMPFYEPSAKRKNKANRVLSNIFERGNFGHNKDRSFYNQYPFVIRKAWSLWFHTQDAYKLLFIFPQNAVKVWGGVILRGIVGVFKGIG